MVIHNGSTYDYHFIIEQLAEEFKGQFKCMGENMEKYITFSVPIKKKIKKWDNDETIKKNVIMMKQLKKCDNDKTITYKLKFIDSFRFMRASLSSLVDNFSEIAKIDCIKCKEKKN